jgi:hypothetical protein
VVHGLCGPFDHRERCGCGVTGALLRHMSCGLHDPKMAGILVHLHGEPHLVRLFFDFGMMTGDEASIQSVNLTRGTSGEMSCMFCMNVKSKRSLDLDHDLADYFVSYTETDLSKIKYHSDETVCAIHIKLQQTHEVQQPRAFVTTQKQLGFSYSIGSILLCPLLKTICKLVSATVYDWMRCILLEGVFSITVGEMMAELRPFKVTYQVLGESVSRWNWLCRISKRAASGKDVFKPAKIEKWYKEGSSRPLHLSRSRSIRSCPCSSSKRNHDIRTTTRAGSHVSSSAAMYSMPCRRLLANDAPPRSWQRPSSGS